jgi:hypothetical protein
LGGGREGGEGLRKRETGIEDSAVLGLVEEEGTYSGLVRKEGERGEWNENDSALLTFDRTISLLANSSPPKISLHQIILFFVR